MTDETAPLHKLHCYAMALKAKSEQNTGPMVQILETRQKEQPVQWENFEAQTDQLLAELSVALRSFDLYSKLNEGFVSRMKDKGEIAAEAFYNANNLDGLKVWAWKSLTPPLRKLEAAMNEAGITIQGW